MTLSEADSRAIDHVVALRRCAAVVRPDVVLFGEELPVEKLVLPECELVRGFDLVFSVGTSSVFP